MPGQPMPAEGQSQEGQWQWDPQQRKWLWVVPLAAAAINYLGQRQVNQQAERASRHAGEVDITTTRTGDPFVDPYRQAAMQAAFQALFPGRALPPMPGSQPFGTTATGGGGQTGPVGSPGAGGGGSGWGSGTVPGVPGGGGAPGVWDNSGGWGYGGPPPLPTGPSSGAGAKIMLDGQEVVTRNGQQGIIGRSGQFQPLGRQALARATRGGGGGGGAQPAPFAGMSPETDAIRGRLMGLPEQNAGMYDTAERFATDTLEGTERNPLRGEASEAARAIAEDPGLAEYINALKGGLGVSKPTSGAGAGKPTGVNYGYGGGWSATSQPTAGAVGTSATGADAALRKLIAGEDAPGLVAAEDAITRRINEGRAASIRDLRARAVGSGFYGGSVYKDLEEGAIARGDQELAAELAQARFGAYSNALGLGTQYDLGMADIGSRERTAAANASAAGAGAAADAASREKLAMYGLWGDALSLGQQGRTGRAGALGDLAGLTSADQRAAFEGVNALGASRRGDLGAAGDLSLGSDVARTNFAGNRDQARVGMAGVGLGRQQLAFDRERFYDPFARISAYTDVLGGLYGNLGSETTTGTDRRSQSPASYGSPLGAALTGAAVGGQLAGAYSGGGKRRQVRA